MKVILSIVNFNTWDLTSQCLRSIFEKQWKNNLEVWVVDNASTDNSPSKIKEQFPGVKLITNKTNLGFGRGHNQVLEKAMGEYYFIINSDCKIEDGVFDEMVLFMDKNPQTHISSCKILDFDSQLQPNAGDLPVGLALISWLFNLDFFESSFHITDPKYYQKPKEVGWVSGNFMCLRGNNLKFDKDFFMYFEDAELCYRVKKAGFKVMINPYTSIKHLSGGSLDNPKYRQWLGEYKGLYIFYKKHFGNLIAIFIKFLSYLSILLRIFAFALLGKIRYSYIYGKIITEI